MVIAYALCLRACFLSPAFSSPTSHLPLLSFTTGTLVLPAAITFTGVLIASTFMAEPQWIPLFLLAAILGLPALLILFTARHPVYVVWFVVYLIALPVWNFVLPVYAYWHMDDFSWGETRKVEGPGAAGKDEHGRAEGVFDASHIYMKRWHEFELERCKRAERFALGPNVERDSIAAEDSNESDNDDSLNDSVITRDDVSHVSSDATGWTRRSSIASSDPRLF